MKKTGRAPRLCWTTARSKRTIAMVCSDPPDGFAGWTVRLVGDQAGGEARNSIADSGS